MLPWHADRFRRSPISALTATQSRGSTDHVTMGGRTDAQRGIALRIGEAEARDQGSVAETARLNITLAVKGTVRPIAADDVGAS